MFLRRNLTIGLTRGELLGHLSVLRPSRLFERPRDPELSKRAALWTILALLLAGGLGLRLLYLMTPGLDSDQAIFGLQAIHILRGELPIFQWGYSYMGTLESFIAAPLMLIFGPTRFALNLAPVVFSMLFAWAAYLFAKEAAGLAVAVWVLAFACFPPCFLVWNVVVARGGYSETLALGTLALYMALRAVGAVDANEERNRLIGTGLILGIAFWTHLNATIYGTAILLFWLIERPALLRRSLLWAGVPFLVGSAPFWIGTIESRLATLHFASPPGPALPERLWTLVSYRLPIVVGISFDRSVVATLPYVSWLLLPIQLAAVATTTLHARRVVAPRLRRAARLICLLALSFVVIYLASPFSGLHTQRYLIPLYTVFTITPGFLRHAFGRERRLLGIALGLTVVVLQTIPTLRSVPIFDGEARRAYQDGLEREQRLFAAMEKLQLNAVYTDDYWDGARLTFDSHERIIFANPFKDRYRPYLDWVDGAEHPAFLFRHAGDATAFEATLKLAGAHYRKEIVEEFSLYYAMEVPFGRGPEIPVLAATASDNVVDAPLAFDRDAATRWESMTGQRPGMFFQIDLGSEYEVAELSLWPRSPTEAPRGLRVEVSTRGEIWKTVSEADGYWGPSSWAQGRPVPRLDGWVVVRFAPVRCRWIRITQTGEDPLYQWAIGEIRVRAPGVELPRTPEPPPQRPGRLFCDSVLAARLPGAVRRWQGEIIPRFDYLRDAFLVELSDRLMVPKDDPLLRERRDPRIGLAVAEVKPFGEYALVSGFHLDTDDLQRRTPVHWLYDRQSETAAIDLGAAPVEISGVIVEHREAASSFPRGLQARTSMDGLGWSEPEPLTPRPPQLLWSDEGLLGASLHERVFVFAKSRRARFVKLSADPRQPRFPWIVRKITMLTPR